MRRFRGLRTLRWRLTFTYVLLLAVVLTGLSVFEYATLRVSLITARVDTLTGDVDSAKQLFARTVLRNQTTATAAARFATLTSTVSGRTVTVVVFDSNLNRLSSAPADEKPPTLDATTLRSSAGGHSSPRVLEADSGAVLAVAYAVSNTGGHFYIQVTTSMDSINAVLGRTLGVLLLGSIAALVVASGVGLGLTSRGLRPLNRLTATAGEIASGNLGARSQLSHEDDEIGALGVAFDHMAGNIEAAFKQREESEGRARRFIADASHELRTPVTALKGYIDVMRRGAGRDPASLDAILESMQREADRMRVLVLDLLTLARVDANQPTAPADVDINALIAHLLDDGVPNMPPEVRRSFAPGALNAHLDATALTTIVRNLLVNACKYAPGAAQTWSTERTGATATIRVRDEGPGIPLADLPHVFERFYRGEKTRTREEGGSGLGLAIVQGLARGMGGDVAIASGDGTGTTVTVIVPLVPPAGATP